MLKKKTCNVKSVKKFTHIALKDFKKFKKKIEIILFKIKQFVDQNIKNGNEVYGIGAATKGNTLLNCCNFNDKKIKFILDKSRYKINKFTPGSAIKIIKEDKKLQIKAAIILPWNITNHLIKNFLMKKKIIYISILTTINKIK